MEEGMTATKKSPADEQLDRIEDALIETILNSSEAELREDMKARGKDPDKCLAEIDSLIARAKTDAAKWRLERAKSELQDWRAGKGNVVGFDREAARAKFEKIRARDPELASKMLMAARNGQGLSDNDMEGMLEDLAKLERLDGEDDEDGKK
jgi:hypothetical protein